MKGGLKSKALPEYGDEHIHRDGNPDLSFNGIFGISIERLDSKMLFDPFEQLNDILPINNGFLKSRSITPSIHCVHTACQ